MFVGAHPFADDPVIGVNNVTTPMNPFDIGAQRESLGDFFQRARSEGVIAIKPSDDVAGGAAKSLVDGVYPPFVRGALPMEAAFVFPQNLLRAVFAAAIQNKIF